MFFYCFVIFLVSNRCGARSLSVVCLPCCQGIVLVGVLCVRREIAHGTEPRSGAALRALSLCSCHCPLDKGSMFPMQLCLRWNVPDIPVSVQHSCFVGSMSVRNRREEQSGRAVNSKSEAGRTHRLVKCCM